MRIQITLDDLMLRKRNIVLKFDTYSVEKEVVLTDSENDLDYLESLLINEVTKKFMKSIKRDCDFLHRDEFRLQSITIVDYNNRRVIDKFDLFEFIKSEYVSKYNISDMLIEK